MAWCHQAPSHYLSQRWPRSMSPYGVISPQWVNSVNSWCASTPYNMLWGDVCRECMHINKSQKRCKSSTYSIAHHCGGGDDGDDDDDHCNWPSSQILECTCSISHNAPFRTEMCTFLFWMGHCGIWNRCILGFVKLVYSITINRVTSYWSSFKVQICWQNLFSLTQLHKFITTMFCSSPCLPNCFPRVTQGVTQQQSVIWDDCAPLSPRLLFMWGAGVFTSPAQHTEWPGSLGIMLNWADSRFAPSQWETALQTRLILGLCPANERRRYFVKMSLIGWAQT